MAGDQQATRPDESSSGGHGAPDQPTLITPTLADRPVQSDRTPAETADLSRAAPRDHDRRDRPPGRFGDYELLAEIARGGMGVVYKARQQSLNRVVAVKMILAGQLASEGDVRRFRAEAEAAAHLRHPGIVAIYEVGEHQGQQYFSMEYVEGRSLTSVIRERPLPGRQAAECVKSIAEAIDYAHRQGIVHRDLKPSNILLAADSASLSSQPSTLNPKVTDFGLAKRIEGDSQLTGTGQVLGTPGYMPPEQAAARHEDIGPATDIYALGAILYESVTGRPPFQAATPLETVFQVLEQEPVPPRTLNAAVPPDLETICLKCLEKEPERRYATASHLADELGRFLRGEPIAARPISRPARFWRWCRRNPAVALLSAAVLLSLLMGTIVSTYLAVTATLARNDADYQRDRAIAGEAEAQRLGRREAALRRQEVELRQREAAAREQAETERERAQRNLRTSLVHQVEAVLRSTAAGRKWQALEALRQAAEVQSGADLRTLALRCYDEHDMRPVLMEETARHSALIEAPADPGSVLLVPRSYATSSHLRVHDRQTGRPLGYLRDFRTGTPIAVAADGRVLAANQQNGAAAVWDVGRQELLGELRDAGGQPVSAYVLAVSDDSQLIAVAPPSTISGVFSVLLFDAASQNLVSTWNVDAGHLDCLTFDPAGERLAASVITGRPNSHAVKVWAIEPVEEPRELATLTADTRFGSYTIAASSAHVAFSPDSSRLAVAGQGGTVTLWPAPDVGSADRLDRAGPATPDHVLAAHVNSAHTVGFSPDGRHLISAGDDGRLKLWDAESGRLLADAEAAGGHPLRWSDSRDWFVCGGDVWELSRPATDVRTFSPAPSRSTDRAVHLILFPADEQHLAFGSRLDPVSLASLAGPSSESRLLFEHAYDLAFSPDGRRVWAAELRGHKIEQIATMDRASNPLTRLVRNVFGRSSSEPTEDRTVTVAWTPDGDRLAVTLETGSELRVIDLDSGETRWQHRDASEPSYSVAPQFSPDGQRLIAAGYHGNSRTTVKIFDAQTGDVLHTVEEQQANTAFFRDGTAMLLRDPVELSVRDLETGETQRPLRSRLTVRSYRSDRPPVVSPDGRMCAVSEEDATITVYEFASRKVRSRLPRAGWPSGGDVRVFNSDASLLAAFDGPDVAVMTTDAAEAVVRFRTRPDVLSFVQRGDAERLLMVDSMGNVDSWTRGEPGLTTVGRLEGTDGWHLAGGATLIAPDGRRIVHVQNANITIRIWSLPDCRLLKSADVARMASPVADRVALSPDGRRLAIVLDRPSPSVRNVETGEPLLSFDAAEDYLGWWNCRFTPDGSHLALVVDSNGGKRLELTSLATGEKLAVELPRASNGRFAAASGARRIAWADGEQTAIIDPASGNAHHVPTGNLSAFDFDAAGRLLAGVESDAARVVLCDAVRGEVLLVWQPPARKLTGVALSPSARWLAAGDDEGRVHVVDVSHVRTLLRLGGLDWEP